MSIKADDIPIAIIEPTPALFSPTILKAPQLVSEVNDVVRVLEKVSEPNKSPSALLKSPQAVNEASTAIQILEEVSKPEIKIKELSPLKNTLLMILIALGGYYFGFFVGVFNSLGSGILTNVYGIEDEARLAVINGRINMCFTFGSLSGVLIVTYMTNFIGRRRLLIVSEIFCLVLYFCYTIENLNVLLGVRFLCGMAGGINSAMVPIFITEMIPRSKSGVGNIFSVVVGVSFTFVALAQEYILGREFLLKNWKLVLIWPLPLSAARLILMLVFVRTETPVHYLKAAKGNPEKAKPRILQIYSKIYQKECVELMYQNLLKCEGITIQNSATEIKPEEKKNQNLDSFPKSTDLDFLLDLCCKLDNSYPGSIF